MDSAFDGFSIRDYTSKMRSVDIFKCWPFSTDDVSREDVESWLPPMVVPKPRGCGDELEALRSDRDDDEKPLDEGISRSEGDQLVKSEERLEMVCPVCRVFNAATLTAVNAHIDGCLAQTMREERRQMKSKSKAPKKRSIAEIFEVQEQEEQPKIESVLKFWPFHENPDEVSITVTKFKWWSRRLEAMRSNKVDGEISGNDAECVKSGTSVAAEEEKLEMVCPVCRDFNAATVTAVNAHIDSCLAQAMRDERRQMKMNFKVKPKAPKKRSIAEILTVAPQIKETDTEVVEVDKDDEDEEENKKDHKNDYDGGDSSGVGAVAVFSTVKNKKSTNKRKKKRMKKPKKKSMEENYRVESMNNGKKKMIKKKKKKKNEFIAKKEVAYKRKVQTPVNNPRKLRGTIDNERVALDEIDASTRKKILCLKSSSVEKKQKVKGFNSVGKQQKEVPPVCGILKNQTKNISGRTSNVSDLRDGTEDSHCDTRVITSDRHVKFSGKDDMLGHSSDETMFSVSSDVPPTASGKLSSGSEEAALFEVNRSDEHTSTDINKKKEVCPTVEDEKFSTTPEEVSGQCFLKPCTNQEKSKHLVEKCESSTKAVLHDSKHLHLFDRGNVTTVPYSPYAGTTRTLSALQPGKICSINTQTCDFDGLSSSIKFVDHGKDPTHQIPTVNSNASTRTFLEPSSSYSASCNEANERPQLPSQFYGEYDNNGQTLGAKSFAHMFLAGMVDNSFSLPGSGKVSVRNNCLDESIFGLPLNSHGELINFSSGGKVGMNQPQTFSTSRVSCSSMPINNIVNRCGQEYLSINERGFVQETLIKDCEEPFPHYPARLGVTELQSTEGADIHRPNSDSSSTSNHFSSSFHSELNLTRNSFIEQNPRKQVQKHKGNQMIYLEESSDPVSLSSSQPTMRLMGKDVPISRSSHEMNQFSEDAWADEVSRRRHCSKDVALENSFTERCSQQNLVSGSSSHISTENILQSVKIHNNQALQSNYAAQNGSLGVSRNASSCLLPFALPTSCGVFNRAAHDLPKQFISGAKPLGHGPQSEGATNPCNFAQPVLGFPFSNPSDEEHAQTSWFQRSYRSLPPWLLNSAHEKPPGTPQQFSGPSCKSYPHNKWGGSFTMPYGNHSSVVYPLNPTTSHGQMKTSLCPTPIVQPPPDPVTSVTKPSFTINSGCRSIINFSDRVKFDDPTIEEHRCKNARKRPAANLDDSTTAFMLPNTEVQENLSYMADLTRENQNVEMQRNTRLVELDPRGDSGRKYCRQNEGLSIHPNSYPGVESLKPVGMISSGPVRLSPGAKHILTPSQNMEEDNSKLIHSSIPIAATTDRGRDLEIQRKLTKVYRM